jgi:hypothetical protein
VQIAGERCERCVVRKPFEKLADIGDPEGTFEAGAHFGQPLGKTHATSASCKPEMIAETLEARLPFPHSETPGRGGPWSYKVLVSGDAYGPLSTQKSF